MRGRIVVTLVIAALAAWPAIAGAEPVSGPHETVEMTGTTTQPGAPTGTSFTATYHAAGDPNGDPPYMRKMKFIAHPGSRYDTSVPGRCTASDAEISLKGPAACPADSRLGGGSATGKLLGQVSSPHMDMFNNTDEVILIISTPGVYTISRGQIGTDQSLTFASPTCYPNVSVAECPVDNALQLGARMVLDNYVRDGRGYLTTPPTCPDSGYWENGMEYWWADGSHETLVNKMPCSQTAAAPKPLKIAVNPSRVKVERRSSLVVTAASAGTAVPGVRVRVGRRLLRTGSDGTATVTMRLNRPGLHTLRASAGGYQRATTTFRAVRR
jgi:hypothetical protein